MFKIVLKTMYDFMGELLKRHYKRHNEPLLGNLITKNIIIQIRMHKHQFESALQHNITALEQKLNNEQIF